MLLVSGVPGSGKTYFLVYFMLKLINKIKSIGKDYLVISNIDGLKMPHIDLEVEIAKSIGIEIINPRALKKLRDEKAELERADIKFKKGDASESETAKRIKEDLKKKEVLFEKYNKNYEKFREELVGSPEKIGSFFSVEWFEENYLKGKKIAVILCIDECQRLFGSLGAINKKSQKIFYFFEIHRHLGIDIVLACQNPSAISSRISGLCELHRRAMPKSFFSSFGFFSYHEYSDGKQLAKFPSQTRIKKSIFAEYKSADQDQAVKVKSPFRGVLIMLVLSIAVFFLVDFIGPEKDEAKANKVENKKRQIYENQKQKTKLKPEASGKGVGKDLKKEFILRDSFGEVVKKEKTRVIETRVDTLIRYPGGKKVLYFWDDRLREFVRFNSYVKNNDEKYYIRVKDRVFLCEVVKDES